MMQGEIRSIRWRLDEDGGGEATIWKTYMPLAPSMIFQRRSPKRSEHRWQDRRQDHLPVKLGHYLQSPQKSHYCWETFTLY